MNLQCSKPLPPLRVLIVNPLASSSQLIAVKILSGRVFGEDQSINLTLLVFSNEVPAAEAFKLELEKCAYSCANSLSVSSTVPSVTDADVFCFLANFPNPNYVDFDKIDTDEQFDNLYLIIKIANNFAWPEPPPVIKAGDEKPISIKTRMRMDQEEKPKPVKPIFMADGLVVMDILQSISKNIPRDLFFCPTPLPALAKTVVGDHIKVQCDAINDVFVWAADDVTFYMDVARPLLRQTEEPSGPCDWDLVEKGVLDTLSTDHTNFNASWMKKDCIEKMRLASKRNPYGCIYRAASFAQALYTVWLSRRPRCGDGDGDGDVTKVLSSMGVISDGSLGTYKGLPYTLPVVFSGYGWTVNECFNEDTHLKQEIKKINQAAKQHHARMRLASKRNPYGCIYRAASFAQALHTVWLSRRPRCGDGDGDGDVTKVLSSMGVISDGSLGTYKGLPYTLPVVFSGDGWTVNECFNEDTHLKQEIKKINQAAKQHHARMLAHCQKFLEENVVKMGFVPSVEDTPTYTLGSSSRHPSSRTSRRSSAVEPSL